LVPVLRTLDCVSLAGAVDVPGRVTSLQGVYGDSFPVFGDLGHAVADVGPDLAVVAVPHDCHHVVVEQLLCRGVPTLVEKPPARNSAELRRLSVRASASGTPLGVLLPLRHDVRYSRLLDLLAGSGRPAELAVVATVPAYPGVDSWRTRRARAGGGVTLDLGYHFFDLLVGALGAPTAFTYHPFGFVGRDGDVEHAARITLGFDHGRIGVRMLLDARPGRGFYRIARLRFAGGSWESFVDDREAATRGWGKGHAHCADAIGAKICSGFLRGDGDWRETLERQSHVLNMIQLLYSAAARGRAVGS
jgi:predicted dehydrogenase